MTTCSNRQQQYLNLPSLFDPLFSNPDPCRLSHTLGMDFPKRDD